ncbi:MAG: tRNA (adenosine(37)-N6)-threonylcarbamoyltransferase complex ATPase subunit type 1 TsaE [Pseudooceanicola sp.]|nr:tRNA (adenosine(37)-N6)-threonylcarbamoyltransferase complex ATPase subunit type 1 TsaE [Pseudooceanicola sp.]
MGGVLSCLSSSEAETASLAVRLGAGLRPGDCVLLDGPIGAGKTHFCRALIRSLLAREEDIPSPTFTLVQSYDGVSGPIWHADLYRLGHVDEVMELGLDEAFGTAICLVEWPDRLGGLAPRDALRVGLAPEGGTEDRRRVTFTWDDPKWDARLDGLND